MKQSIAAIVVFSLAALADARTGAVQPLDPRTKPEIEGFLTGMHGTGTGTWSGPDQGLGRLRATSSLSAKGPFFAFDASIARIVPMGAHEPGAEGTLWGEVLEIDADGGTGVAGLIVGEWTQDEEGRGVFMAHMLVATGDARVPLLAVGRVTGNFRTAPPDSGIEQDGVAVIRWAVTY